MQYATTRRGYTNCQKSKQTTIVHCFNLMWSCGTLNILHCNSKNVSAFNIQHKMYPGCAQKDRREKKKKNILENQLQLSAMKHHSHT